MKLRNRKSSGTGVSLQSQLVLLVSAELVLSVLLAFGVDYLLGKWFNVDAGSFQVLELLGICLLIGIFVTRFLSIRFFDPIKQLGLAMSKVSDGDFSVRLKAKHNAKEIGQIYTDFNMMVGELSSTEILQTSFVSNVSHEFKTPIAAIEGYSTLLQDGENLSEQQREYVNKIIFNSKRLSVLTGNILLLSKLETQSIPTNQTVFRLDEQIRMSIVSLEPAWETKKMDFDVELDSAEYYGNESLLHHVWDNLIGNAIKFSPEQGQIKIRLQKHLSKLVSACCFSLLNAFIQLSTTIRCTAPSTMRYRFASSSYYRIFFGSSIW